MTAAALKRYIVLSLLYFVLRFAIAFWGSYMPFLATVKVELTEDVLMIVYFILLYLLAFRFNGESLLTCVVGVIFCLLVSNFALLFIQKLFIQWFKGYTSYAIFAFQQLFYWGVGFWIYYAAVKEK